MQIEKTIQALAAITDEGLFERLATSVLREAELNYRSLVHPGVNVAGKTVKSPLDGICFVPGANPPHMIAVHHTTTARDDLEKKWLHDPSTVIPRKGSRPTAPAGDLIKTAGLVADERRRTPNLRATLVLTTNEEPSEALVRAVEAAGRHRGLEIDIWSRSRLSHILDNQPTGQWIRRSFLHIEQEQLSTELLHELSKKSLKIHIPPDNPIAWVSRALDAELMANLRYDVTFLVAGSGLGKSVACYRKLMAHVEDGAFGVIIPHEAVASAVTLEQAVELTLHQMYPPLAAAGTPPLSLCSPERRLLLIVEDINRSGKTQLLVEKLAGWSRTLTKDDKSVPSNWRLLCPLWPEALASLGDQVRKRIDPLIISAGGFSEDEGSEAVLVRARLNGRELSSLTAKSISHALGYDPLLIALHEQGTSPDPHKVIGHFIEGSLSRAASVAKDHPAADYRQALRSLGGEMLKNRQIELGWREISGWAELKGDPLRLLSRLAHHGELIRLTGRSDNQRISFRHDRVRDWLLADAAADLNHQNLLTEVILAEPFFAEVIGAVLAWEEPEPSFLQRVAVASPLALFHAFRLLGDVSLPHREMIIQAIHGWLNDSATHDRSNLHLRWESLGMLAETDSPDVLDIVRKYRDQSRNGLLARLRNGDISGGIEFCIGMNPGVGAPWRDVQIEHAMLSHGRTLLKGLEAILRQMNLEPSVRIGALRLAGHIADSSLGSAIEACWAFDECRQDHLVDYLWSFGECCGDDSAHYLGPVCDYWAALSDKSDKKYLASPRDRLAGDELRWAFHRWPPVAAIEYFVQRGSQDALRWPITYMLNGMDNPKAVCFIVQELAAIQRRLEGTNTFSHFVMTAKDDWRRAQEDGRPMSRASRGLLLGLWRDQKSDKHLRAQAFTLWAATQDSDDIEVLRATDSFDEHADNILWQRLIRGDQRAIPMMIEKLASDDNGYWWQCGRYIWSLELTEALDEFLERRSGQATRTWNESTIKCDWIVHELIMRLPERDAERLLLKHWSHLRFAPHYVQAALYVATPCLLEAAQKTINACPDPAKLLDHLGRGFGISSKGSLGLTRETQVRALAPYLAFLSPMDIQTLWDACNDRGWFTIRRELLDGHLQEPSHRLWNHDNATAELDKMTDPKHLNWIDHWLDDFVKTGVSWSEILAEMTVWLGDRRSLEALRVVAAAVKHQGTRKDLGVLRIYEVMPETAATQLIMDTEFVVRRRSIH